MLHGDRVLLRPVDPVCVCAVSIESDPVCLSGMRVQFARRVVVYPDMLSPFGDGCQVGFVAIELLEGCAVA